MQIQQLYTTKDQLNIQNLLTVMSVLCKLSADHISVLYNDKNVQLE